MIFNPEGGMHQSVLKLGFFCFIPLLGGVFLWKLWVARGISFPLSDRDARYRLDCQEVYWLRYENKNNQDWDGAGIAVGSSNQDLEPFCGKYVKVSARTEGFEGRAMCRTSEDSGWCAHSKLPTLQIRNIQSL